MGGSGPGPHPRGKLKLRGIWSRPTPKREVEGDLAEGGACSGGVPALRGVPAPGVACSGRGACSGGSVETPPRDGYCCRQYASYWNAFMF